MFIILGIIELIIFLGVLFLLRETLSTEKRIEGNMLAVVKTFRGLPKDRQFMGIACTEALFIAIMFALNVIRIIIAAQVS